MTYAALAALSGIDGMAARIERIAQAVEAVIAGQADTMKTLASKGYERVVYLGSHVFKGLAREAALKLLEPLTDGGMIAAYDSPLGFRHGPKTIPVNGRTLVVVFLSNDAYTRHYDLDLLDEYPARWQARRLARDLLAVTKGFLQELSASSSPPWPTPGMPISWFRSLPRRRFLRSSRRSAVVFRRTNPISRAP